MKLVGDVKRKMPELQEKLASSQYTAEAGGGAVSATVSGKLMIIDVKIRPDVLTNADVAMLEDLVKAAVSAAQQKASQAAEAAMKELTGGMNLPGLEGMF